MLHNKRSHALRSLHSATREKPPLAAARESLHAAMKTQGSQKKNLHYFKQGGKGSHDIKLREIRPKTLKKED